MSPNTEPDPGLCSNFIHLSPIFPGSAPSFFFFFWANAMADTKETLSGPVGDDKLSSPSKADEETSTTDNQETSDVKKALDRGMSEVAEEEAGHFPESEKELERRLDVPAQDARSISSQASPPKDMQALSPKQSALSRIRSADLPKSFALAMIVVALFISMFLVALDMTIIGTAIPRITDQFKSLDDIGWYGSAFFLTLAAFQSSWGKAYRYFPLKGTFLASIVVFEVGSLICAVAKDSKALIVGRSIAGAGGAGVSSGAYTIIGFSAPPRLRPAFTGILGMGYGIASVLGPLIGGVFTDHLTWRWCFYINLPLGGAAAAIILLSFTAPAAARPAKASPLEKIKQMDLPGVVILIGANICFLLAMQWGGVTKPWNGSTVIGTLVGFGVLMIVFAVIQIYSGEYASIPMRLLKQRSMYPFCIYIFFNAAAYFVLLYYVPLYFQSTRGVSPSDSGVRNLPFVFGSALFSIASGVLITATGHYMPILVFGSAIATVGAGLIYTLDVNTTAGKWIGYQILSGAGHGLTIQIPVIVAQATVSPSDLSSASSIILFFMTLGGAIFISSAQAGFANKLLKSVPEKAPSVNPQLVVATGASQLKDVFKPDVLPGVIASYMDGIKIAFALTIALVGVSTLVSVTPKWRNIKGKVSPGGAA